MPVRLISIEPYRPRPQGGEEVNGTKAPMQQPSCQTLACMAAWLIGALIQPRPQEEDHLIHHSDTSLRIDVGMIWDAPDQTGT